MTVTGKVGIIGNGVEAWLSACVLARFISNRPQDVIVFDEQKPDDATPLTARPDMSRLHAAVGLEPETLLSDGQPVSHAAWEATSGLRIPYGARLIALNDIPLSQIWARARTFGENRPLNDFLQPVQTHGYELPRQAYAAALESIAHRAGVSTGESAGDVDVDVWIVASSGEDELFGRSNVLSVGWSSLPHSLHPALQLHLLHKHLMALIKVWPCESFSGVEISEFERQKAELMPCLIDMSKLLGNDTSYSDIYQHRIDVWSVTGRIIRVEKDPFQPHEWMLALLSGDHEPEAFDRRVLHYDNEDIQAFLNEQVAKRAIHA